MTKDRLAVVALLLCAFVGGMALAQTSRFDDVPPGHYAEDAIAWAVENGITQGCGEAMFCPDDPVTRAQIVTFLHRYAQKFDSADSAPTTSTTPGSDLRPGERNTNEKVYWPPIWVNNPQGEGLRLLSGIRIAPENCADSDQAHYENTGWERPFGGVGYLTHEVLDLSEVDIDHVLALHEAWCSGVRATNFGKDSRNLEYAKSSVNRGKGGRDPREWWDTNGATTPRKVDYPGWCQYLYLHVELKLYWQATMDQEEYDFVKAQLGQCPTVESFDPVSP